MDDSERPKAQNKTKSEHSSRDHASQRPPNQKHSSEPSPRPPKSEKGAKNSGEQRRSRPAQHARRNPRQRHRAASAPSDPRLIRQGYYWPSDNYEYYGAAPPQEFCPYPPSQGYFYPEFRDARNHARPLFAAGGPRVKCTGQCPIRPRMPPHPTGQFHARPYAQGHYTQGQFVRPGLPRGNWGQQHYVRRQGGSPNSGSAQTQWSGGYTSIPRHPMAYHQTGQWPVGPRSASNPAMMRAPFRHTAAPRGYLNQQAMRWMPQHPSGLYYNRPRVQRGRGMPMGAPGQYNPRSMRRFQRPILMQEMQPSSIPSTDSTTPKPVNVGSQAEESQTEPVLHNREEDGIRQSGHQSNNLRKYHDGQTKENHSSTNPAESN